MKLKKKLVKLEVEDVESHNVTARSGPPLKRHFHHHGTYYSRAYEGKGTVSHYITVLKEIQQHAK